MRCLSCFQFFFKSKPIVKEQKVFKVFDECSICLEAMTIDTICAFECGHIFHEVCLSKWMTIKKICPLCGMNSQPEIMI